MARLSCSALPLVALLPVLTGPIPGEPIKYHSLPGTGVNLKSWQRDEAGLRMGSDGAQRPAKDRWLGCLKRKMRLEQIGKFRHEENM